MPLLRNVINPRRVMLDALRRLPGANYGRRVVFDLFERPAYAFGLYHGAQLARALGLTSISAVEFGASATNQLVTHDADKDATQSKIVARYSRLVEEAANKVVGSVASDLVRQSSGTAGEIPLGDVVADAQLAAASAPETGQASAAGADFLRSRKLRGRRGKRSDSRSPCMVSTLVKDCQCGKTIATIRICGVKASTG